LALPADHDALPLAADIEGAILEKVPGAERGETSFFWDATPVSAPEDATGEFSPQGRSSSVWWVPPSGGFFTVRCQLGIRYKVPRNTVLTGAVRSLASGEYIVLGTGEIPVLVPAPGSLMTGEDLDGVPLGRYPDPLEPGTKEIVSRHADVYRRPEWFFRVDASNRDLHVSRHFTLGDFDMTYDYWKPDYPVDHEYIALHPLLLDKLEILDKMIRSRFGEKAEISILAGYRSPMYNEDVKREDMAFTQTSRYSMHMYGRAVDFIIDEDHNGRMDDLNGDGTSDLADAVLVREIVDAIDLENPPGPGSITGGCGIYPRHDIKARPVQTPYLHIDVRGYWGDSGRPVRWQMP
jgi:hypothetical protein